MNARGKLNQAYLNGALVVAIMAGSVTQSAAVFLLVFFFGVASSLGDGGIRMTCRGASRAGQMRRRR